MHLNVIIIKSLSIYIYIETSGIIYDNDYIGCAENIKKSNALRVIERNDVIFNIDACL